MTKIRKAIAGGYSSAAPLIGAAVSYGLLDPDQGKWVAGFLVALTPLLTFLGVFKAKPNAPE